MATTRADGGERVLAAVLFSDICGYSRQMGADEDGTLERLEWHNQLFRARANEHAGRVVKTVGDSFMITFDSAVQAVRCGLDVQRDLAAHNAALEPAQRIEVRVGVHLGDVVLRRGDLFGATVNIASRIEGRAPPGSVTVSQAVFEQAQHKVYAEAEDLGPVVLKNIDGPVHLYALRSADARLGGAGGSAGGGRTSGRATAALSWLRLRWRWLAAGLLVVSIAGLALRRMRQGAPASGGDEVASPSRAPAPSASLPPPASAGRRGGTLRLALPDGPGKLSPYGVVDTLQRSALRLVIDPLLDADDHGRPRPGVIDQWQHAAGGRRLRLRLRSGLWFHPHPCLPGGRGRLATAADVVYSLGVARTHGALMLPLERGSAGGSGGAAATAQQAIALLPDGRVEIRLARPVGTPERALREVWLLPADLDGCENVDDMRQPVGTGPFRFSRPAELQLIHLARAPHYWERAPDGSPLPYLDAIEVQWASDVTEAIGKVARGDLDVLVVGAPRLPDILDAGAPAPPRLRASLQSPALMLGIDVAADQSQLAVLTPLGNAGSVLSDRRLRRALALSLDRAALVKRFKAELVPSGRFLEPRLLGRDPRIEPLAEDVRRARALLAAAGYAGGSLPPLLRIGYDRPAVEPVVREAARQLRQVGWRISAVALGADEFAHAFERRPVDLLIAMFGGGIVGDEPDPFLAHLIRFARDYALPGLCAGGTALIEGMTGASDRAGRRRAYRAAEQWLLDCLPLIPLGRVREHAPSQAVIASKRASGLIDRLTGRVLPGHLRRLRLASLRADNPRR